MTNQRIPSKQISIDGKKISKSSPVYFIAEIGSNFDQDLSRAKDLIYMAKEAGADAAKFQHYTAQSLVSDVGFRGMAANNSHQASWKKSVYDTYDDASINQDWTEILRDTCADAGLAFFTSPYSFDLVDLVDDFVPAHKIGSGDITWTEIIEHIARKDKPVLLATGASNMADVQRAMNVILGFNSDIILMQCNTNYTASRDNFNYLHLNVVSKFQEMYPGIITGLSDHTQGDVSVLGAVALGVRVIEKHFTDSIEREGPDHAFSMTPTTWRDMVERTRDLQAALGIREKEVEPNEKETMVLQRRSICAARDLSKGTIISEVHLNMLRPCPDDAIQPFEAGQLVGRVLLRDIKNGEHLKWEDIN